MTNREYVLRKYPEAFDPRHRSLLKGCPTDYGVKVNCTGFQDCKDCWNAEFLTRLKIRLSPGGVMPTRAHSTDAGLDLYSPVRQVIRANDHESIDLLVHALIPSGHVGLITSKSGLMAEGITQLVIFPIITPDLELVDSLEDTERGGGGFGSTGKF